jgi:hypothetical protein
VKVDAVEVVEKARGHSREARGNEQRIRRNVLSYRRPFVAGCSLKASMPALLMMQM